MHYIFFILLLLFTVDCTANIHSEQTSLVRIPAARSTLDISHDYHKTLLNMALQQQAKTMQLKEVPFISEQRVIAEIVKRDMVDVYWLGADKNLSNDLMAIPIPTTMGLIGFRKFIIKKQNIKTFAAISNLEQLQKLTACQGRYWPDTKILNNARLKVTTSVFYEDLFKMLDAGRCDYFPRGYHDHSQEVQLRQSQYPDFISYDNILLHYPFAVFFYVSKDKAELSQRIETGLLALAEKGEIRKLMQTHELTRHIFPLQQPADTKLFIIDNPYLPVGAETDNRTLWLQASDFIQ